MTKAELVAEVSSKTNLPKSDVALAVDGVVEAIKEALSKGEDIYLRGLGTFAVKKRAERVARNMQTNAAIIIPAHNVPVFKASKSLNDLVK